MPKVDLSITISAIVAVAAIISPVLTALINNHHHLKMKKLELKEQTYRQNTLYKRDIFEKYLNGLSLVSHTPSPENINLYAKYYPIAYIYLPAEVQKIMSVANTFIEEECWDNIIEYVDLISSKVYEELQKL